MVSFIVPAETLSFNAMSCQHLSNRRRPNTAMTFAVVLTVRDNIRIDISDPHISCERTVNRRRLFKGPQQTIWKTSGNCRYNSLNQMPRPSPTKKNVYTIYQFETCHTTAPLRTYDYGQKQFYLIKLSFVRLAKGTISPKDSA